MKKEVGKDNANRLVNCGMVILVSCAYRDKRNITTCAWHMPVSKVPSAVTIALAKKHFSSELIRKSGEFIINIPDWSLLDKVVKCGSVSGVCVDKFKETGFTSQKAHSLAKTPVISECAGSIECALIDTKEVGDHFLFLGEVVHAEADEDYFKDGFWDTRQVSFIFYLGSTYFFKSSPFEQYKKNN